MEIKAELLKPYTEEERINFIVTQNHQLGYEIRETDESLQAWGYTQEEILTQAKEQKTQEAKDKAYDFLANGNALFEFEEGKHIEATDGNIAKFTAYLIGFEKGLYEVVKWNTKEDENVELNFEQVAFILQGLANVQSDVWTFKYPYFLKQIELAQTVEEVENIIIDYEIEVAKGEEDEIKD